MKRNSCRAESKKDNTRITSQSGTRGGRWAAETRIKKKQEEMAKKKKEEVEAKKKEPKKESTGGTKEQTQKKINQTQPEDVYCRRKIYTKR